MITYDNGGKWEGKHAGRGVSDSGLMLAMISENQWTTIDNDCKIVISNLMGNRTPAAVNKRLANISNAFDSRVVGGKYYFACWFRSEMSTNWVDRVNQIRRDGKQNKFIFDDKKLELGIDDIYIIDGASHRHDRQCVAIPRTNTGGKKYHFSLVEQPTPFNQKLTWVQHSDILFVRMMLDHYVAMQNSPAHNKVINNIKDTTLTRYLAADDDYFAPDNWFRGFIAWFFCEGA